MIETAEQVVEEMMKDKSAYLDFVTDFAIRHLKSDDKLLKSWADWLNGVGRKPL